MDTSENDLRGVVKALSDVVAPALDPADPLAGEQLRLAIGYLDFMRTRLDFLAMRLRFELRHNLDQAKALAELKSGYAPELAEALDAAIDEGERVLDSPLDDAEEARRITAKLAAAARIVVRESAASPGGHRGAVERVIVGHAEERIMFERAWFLPVGGERLADDVPPLASLVRR